MSRKTFLKWSGRAALEESLRFMGSAEGVPSNLEPPRDPRVQLLDDITEVERIRERTDELGEAAQAFVDETLTRAWWWAVDQLGLPESDEVRAFLEREHDHRNGIH